MWYTRSQSHTHTLYHLCMNLSSIYRFYSYICYNRACFLTSPLLLTYCLCKFMIFLVEVTWPIWYVISMSAALTILWNRPNVSDVLGGKKKKDIATLSLGQSCRCIRSVLPGQHYNFHIRLLGFSVFCMQIAHFLVSHGPQQMFAGD